MGELSAKDVDFRACDLSARFLNALKDYLRDPKTRKTISALTEIPEKTLVDYQNGRTSPSVDRFLLIAVASNAHPSHFFPEERDDGSPGIPSIGDIPSGALAEEVSRLSARAQLFLREALRGTAQRREIAKMTGIPENALKDYYTGRTTPPIDRFFSIALAGGHSPAEAMRADRVAPALTHAKQAASTITIPVLDVMASAGPGATADVVRAEAEFEFPAFFLERLGLPASGARLESLRAKGSSMSPTITDGALLMIDRAQSSLPPEPRPNAKKTAPDIYVFIQGGDLRLKRLQRLDGDFVAIHSDNHADHPAEFFNLKRNGSLKVIGKVIWWDNRL